MLHQVLLSLASNCDQEQNLQEAQRRLLQAFKVCRFTPSIWTQPVNSHRPDLYINQLLRCATSMTVGQLQAFLKQQEAEMGRTPDDRAQGIVRIDLDLLQYDDLRYHQRDWDRDYIKQLLAFEE
jgi:2-amino-4-hydroxy-6-hydroxymethyldihydropteridine diphosphokinase